jgi:hypothetical protein
MIKPICYSVIREETNGDTQCSIRRYVGVDEKGEYWQWKMEIQHLPSGETKFREIEESCKPYDIEGNGE